MTVRKRKAKPKITVSPAPSIEETKSEVKQVGTILIRCVWDSRLIVGANKTPSGMRYEFTTGEKKPVLETDYEYLLDLRSKAPGCCGGAGGSLRSSTQKYFEEV